MGSDLLWLSNTGSGAESSIAVPTMAEEGRLLHGEVYAHWKQDGRVEAVSVWRVLESFHDYHERRLDRRCSLDGRFCW